MGPQPLPSRTWGESSQASDFCPSPTPLPPSGLCVATPVRLRVFREFHLHLRLPFSVRRFEQLELRPVLYNYLDKNLTVRPCGSLRAQGASGSWAGEGWRA